MKVVLVAAVAENGVIGANGGMPWRLKSDLAHFRRLTINKPVVMGRKTWQSIGRPLPQRTNIVITRDPNFLAHGALVVPSFDAALAAARQDAEARGTDEIMVIGGSDIFLAAMPLADRLEITHVHAAPEGDVRFPPIDPAVWREESRQRHPGGENDSAEFSVTVYLRR
ncbi:MAG TPA: dihydrofolate reductase [Pseudolabrys sp.]|nr:dihydrofolate reductase [Pseudolabrys sp.]